MNGSRCIQFLILALISVGILKADGHKHYGLAPLQDHEQQHLEKRVHKVVKVHPNSIAAERTGIEASLEANEFSTLQTSTADALQMISTGGSLPSSVNNALLPSFPPIGDQAQLGSCVAWGSTYYQASHEIGLLNGINNKAGFAGVLSPKWTYDLLNNGVDGGLSPVTAFQLLASNGAVSITSFPYDTNYTAWDLNPQDWISAISNRMASYVLIPGLGGSGAQNLTAIKQALVNGHVLTFATFIDSWVFTQVKTDPQNIDNNYVGQYAAVYMNGQNGGHFMTIVGYDDNLWIDVNGNGQVNAGERGAFLIANSWGASWGNAGFIWISYDAFLATSAVAGGPTSGRVAAGTYLNSSVISVVPKAKNYSPSLIAQFTLGQSQRNQISVQAAVSSTSQTTPGSIVGDDALSDQGGALEFNGTSSTVIENATLAFDFTDFLVSGTQTGVQRYYLMINDGAANPPTQLLNYSLIDLTRSNQINAPNLPKTFSNTTSTIYLDYNFLTGTASTLPAPPPPPPAPPPSAPPTPPPPPPAPPPSAPPPPPPAPPPSAPPPPPPPPPVPIVLTISFTSPAAGSVLLGTPQVSVTTSSSLGVSSVQLYVDNALIGPMMGSRGSYAVALNTKNFSNGAHQLKAVVTDTLGNQAQSTLNVTVNNVAPTVSFVSPTENATLTGTSQVTVHATGSPAVALVQLYVDSTLVGSMTSSSGSYVASLNTKNFSSGAHQLKAVVTDTLGNQAQSILNITVNNVVPTVTFVSPAVNATLAGTSQITVNATGSPAVASVQLYVDAVLVSYMTVSGSSYTTLLNTLSFSNGSHQLKAIVTDTKGNQAQSTLNVNISNIAPTLTFVSPAANATLSGTAQITVRATGSPAVASVQLYVDAVLVSTMTSSGSSYVASLNTKSFTNGSHRLKVVVTDTLGNQVHNGLTINIINLPAKRSGTNAGGH